MGITGSGRPEASRASDLAGLAGFLGELEQALHGLDVRTALCWWEKYTGGPGTGLDDLEQERSRLLLDPRCSAMVEEWLGQPVADAARPGTPGRRPRPADPVVSRKLELLAQAVLHARVNGAREVRALQNRIHEEVIRFRPVIAGRESSYAERERVLRYEPDRSLRREAWVSTVPLSLRLAAPTVELLRRRNALAAAQGYDTYADLALGLSGLDRGETEDLLRRLAEATEPGYRTALEAAAAAEGLDVVEPWDVSYLVERAFPVPPGLFPKARVPANADRLVRAFGVDPESLGIRVVCRDIPFAGLSVPVDPPRDIRILANPQDGYGYLRVVYHEYGHALHAACAGEASALLRMEPPVFGEAMAQVWAWFAAYPEWLTSLGLEGRDVRQAVAAHRLSVLHTARARAAEALWELRAYEAPTQDLTALAATLEGHYLLCRPQPVHRWAASPFPSAYPVYRQNYVLAELVAAATHRVLRDGYGDDVIGNPAVFRGLAESYWRPAGLVPWQEKVGVFTGGGPDLSVLRSTELVTDRPAGLSELTDQSAGLTT